MKIQDLFKAMMELKASDLHIQVGAPPMMRVLGALNAIKAPALDAATIKALIAEVASAPIMKQFEAGQAQEFCCPVQGFARFRMSAFWQNGTPSMVARILPWQIPSFQELNLPPILEEIVKSERGIILVTGTGGMGKTTTMAALVNAINQTQRRKILTIEELVEIGHENAKSMVAQIQIGRDSADLHEALARSFHQDADVIMIGEIRDFETLRAVIEGAETGKLVISGVLSNTVTQCVQRLVAMVPVADREILIPPFARSLQAAIGVRLARRKDGTGRVPACEIIRSAPAVASAVTEARYNDLDKVMANRDRGMTLFADSLVDLVNNKVIAETEAIRMATSADELGMKLRGFGTKTAQ